MKASKREAIAAEVANILQAERKKRDLSMTVVAERAGLSHQMISFVEREMRSPTLDTLLRITEALEISAGEVLQRAERAAKRSK
jgi:transcriptional regulator with XRE-family HTH domain